MRRLHKLIIEEFAVQHVTLQMERSAAECTERHHVDHLMARSLHETYACAFRTCMWIARRHTRCCDLRSVFKEIRGRASTL